MATTGIEPAFLLRHGMTGAELKLALRVKQRTQRDLAVFLECTLRTIERHCATPSRIPRWVVLGFIALPHGRTGKLQIERLQQAACEAAALEGAGGPSAV